MTLRQDCELWATFDSEDVDPNRGIVRDRSGKGRTLQANGGPTYGQSSPVGEAVAFDGTDDRFETTRAENIDGATEWTVAALSLWDGGNSGDGKYVQMHGGFSIFTNHDAGDKYKTQFSTPSTNVSLRASDNTYENEWVLLVATFNTGTATLSIEGETVDIESVSDTTLSENGKPTKHTIGQTTGSTTPFSGEIGFVVEWSRALSDAEIAELNRMTDRMVSKL